MKTLKKSSLFDKMNIAQISSPSILISPSYKLKQYIHSLTISDNLPQGISNILYKNKVKTNFKSVNIPFILTEDDKYFIKKFISKSHSDYFSNLTNNTAEIGDTEKLLSLQDIYWLYEHLQEKNKVQDEKIYLHELMEGSQIILPKNALIPRSEELEKRCQKLKAEQDNRLYHEMTKHVDNVKKTYPEDTIGYQLKQMNRNLLAIFQFILSVAAGFAFGFIGVELITGSLDFGFRLLLGIICALTIALAELYFLAKKLNEEIQFEHSIQHQQKQSKLD
ncbi:unnamed protein product [Acanthoscelides obtectus]|uniref:Transmembrane protein 199 n=1 Tax=Acanthoscelides obtectus TaxID=200917 RepID=A0A9P0KGR9_ACAOB|nr:unnamed protein product [Acanthoscelides obtectus]CAK1627869.1 Transmembrane protein 199 [Acanthoscelides obtectus]